MDYNELKQHVLSLFEESKEYHSGEVRELLLRKKDLVITDKAAEMALLRYWRQGLLGRTRRAGRFYYNLTVRGLARREWLLRPMLASEV